MLALNAACTYMNDQHLPDPYSLSNIRILIDIDSKTSNSLVSYKPKPLAALTDDLNVTEKVIEKINYLFEKGLPTTTLSMFIRVNRSIIIDWLNGYLKPNKIDLDRIDEIIKLLDAPFHGNFKTVFRLSKSDDGNGKTLCKILSNKTIDKRAFERWLTKRRLTIQRLNAQEDYKKAHPLLKDKGYDDGVGVVDPSSVLRLINRA